MKVSLSIFLLSLLMFISCANSKSISTDIRTKTFDAGYNETFNAVVKTLSKEGYKLDFSDQKSGVIDTDYRTASKILPSFTKDERIKINAILNEEGKRTQVQLTINTQNMSTTNEGKSGGLTKEKAISYYKNLLMKIGKQL
ncbi:MAG TPA: hypothetical protein VJ964_10925 [Balneolaceae bacterium]|nr:hypothetical protein [Balneolaceae bacterium]